ncbi:hypothetical protein [Rhizobium sp. BK176]|uniref:hypothetical protein n=1 Tax=Rhizobium sp. BK176 TaxID=2587071 RepID=UPI002168470D|nr:hypothetical protein [Rhizobium sp. BK176]MCS4088442.1 hypothetical protein [Rhizobium sp. BK176]
MGSDVTIGLRTAEGEVIAARSYSHVIDRILAEADFVTPNEVEFRGLVEEYRSSKGYGPLPAAPFGSGILFADFQTRTIYSFQSIAFFPAFTKDSAVKTLFKSPERFDIYVPHFSMVLEFAPRPTGDYRMPDIVERNIERAADQEGLWKAAGIETVPGTYANWNDGKEEVLARAIVPRGDFLALMVDLPGWSMITCNPRNKAEVSAIYDAFAAGIPLGADDVKAWEDFIAELE